MAGRRPKPTELKLVTGNAGKRPLNENEPKPSSDIPRMPSHLPPRAKAVWKRLCKLLSDMGVLTLADALALERLCDIYAEIIELQKDIAKNGRTYESIRPMDDVPGPGAMEQYLIKPNPAVGMLADADRRFKSYLVEFGLTPAARTKIQISNGNNGKQKKDALDEYFG
ncbi:phage terminase small subunit P27 family [Shewanella sp. KCT]|uniref:phage terminase small subunit P27 family n=1 Tax=Shewanella sp. KCT TaxID=2569535 RepID=UPI001183F67E|nr:phage terminase small subunit P27 family [Shewanella sp. KCT]TVP11794.1 terminase [Shewanella sp. KCT]